MINAFYSLIVAVFMLQFFSFGISMSKIDKALINIPISIFQISIPLDKEEYYFDSNKLENDVNNYFKEALYPLIKDYSCSFYYYDTKDYLFCTSEICDGVEITLEAPILFYTFKKTMYYEIKVNK